MKSLGRIVLVCAFFAVLLLGGRTLIRGPEEEAAAAPSAAPLYTAIVRAEPEPMVPLLPGTAQPSRERTGQISEEVVTVPAVVSDRNGQPIASRAWSRTVYQACAPEGIPG